MLKLIIVVYGNHARCYSNYRCTQRIIIVTLYILQFVIISVVYNFCYNAIVAMAIAVMSMVATVVAMAPAVVAIAATVVKAVIVVTV